MYNRKDIVKLKNKAEKYSKLCNSLLRKSDARYSGDRSISSNVKYMLENIEDFINFIEVFNPLAFFQKRVAIRHVLSEDKILKADDWNDHYVTKEIRLWRRNLENDSYENIPIEFRKEIFDYFFRNDFYGELNHSSITRLSEGTNDLDYFRPPTIVEIALSAAIENNWFGYSDPLGHVDTRMSIMKLEQCRRNENQIDVSNVAVVQGSTSGLHAVLSMISKSDNCKKTCVIAVPTYSPIFDDAAFNFELNLLKLSHDYEANYEELFKLASSESVAVILFSIPHNPYGLRKLRDKLGNLCDICKCSGTFLIIDEVIFDPEISSYLNPIKYQNLIIISSYSKMYNIPGLKLGHLLADKGFIQKFYRHASTTYGSPPSFLYLTSTCIATLEHMSYSHCFNNSLPNEIKKHVSDLNLIFGEFKIWKKFYSLNVKFQHLVLNIYYQDIGHVSIEKVMGLDDLSPNVIIRVKGNGSAYKDSLKVLARSNVSVVPIECFSPPSTWLRDLRVTLAIEPRRLASGLANLICALDEIYSEETKNNWLHEDDIVWLRDIGLFDDIKEFDGWAKSHRTCKRTLEILKFYKNDQLRSDITYRIASLSQLGLVWKNLSIKKRKYLYRKVTGEEFIGDASNYREILFALLNCYGKLSSLPKLSDLLKSNMIEFFRMDSIKETKNIMLQVVFVASELQWLNMDLHSISSIKNILCGSLDKQGYYDFLSKICEELQSSRLLPNENSVLPSSSMVISDIEEFGKNHSPILP